MNMSESEENRGCFRMKIIEYHDVKTLLGPCFVSFSLPLFVPGVVLTVVGSYGNENSFPIFGAWHLVGIITLCIAVILLISGIILKCCYRPIISADIEQHLSPTASMVTGNKNLGYNEDIYGSKSAQNTNKVGHHDLKSSHTVASTHETKQNSNKDSKHHFLANTALTESQGKKQQKSAESSQNNPPQNSNANVTRSSNKPKPPPPSYDKLQSESKSSDGKQTRTNVVDTTQGGVTTKVTATIKAEAETVQASGSRDHSSDASENSKFLPVKKKKKKKKRKSRESLDPPDGIKKRISKERLDETGSDLSSSRRELPELRMRPSLIHEGSEHHHHDLHVHFKNSTVDTPNNSQELVEDDDIRQTTNTEH